MAHSEASPAPARRKCGKCGQSGHNVRTCTNPPPPPALQPDPVPARVVADAPIPAAVPAMRFSEKQTNFFAACADPSACGGKSPHKLLRARAGTGKTTTIIAALNYFAAHLLIMLCAFNSKIAKELTKRITNPNAQASTLHAIGYAAIRAFFGSRRSPRVVEGNEREIGLARFSCGSIVPDDVVALIGRLCTKAREIIPLARSGSELIELAQTFECTPNDDMIQQGYDLNFITRKAYICMETAAREQPCIDYADMIYLPIRNGWLRPLYDVVIVDEAQDMTEAQLMLAEGVVKPGGRIIIVGDNRQAIYGFRGASADSIDNLKARLGADELPLNVTYRCGKRIVAEAQRLVPDFEAHESNPDGEVLSLTVEDALKLVEPGDFVLSRSNAPLVRTAMRMIREGRRVRIEGRDIGAGLKAAVTRLAGRVNSMPNFLGKLRTWEEREIARAQESFKEPEAAIEKITDKAETLRALAEGMSGIAEMLHRIDTLFSDRDDAGVAQGFITCSSVHKSKGLEAPRVVLLTDTFKARRDPKRPPTAKQLMEEENIRYVAITRAQKVLIYASDENKPTGPVPRPEVPPANAA